MVIFYHRISNPLRIIEYASAEKMYHIGVGKLMGVEIRAGLVAMVSSILSLYLSFCCVHSATWYHSTFLWKNSQNCFES